MLVSASRQLKFHNWSDEDVQLADNLIISKIINFSWSYDNRYLIFLEERGRPEILNLRDINNIRKIHIITAIDNASAVLFKRKTKKCVAIGTSSATVALYDTRSKSIVKLFRVSSPVVSMDFNSQDKYLGVACINGKISILNIMDEVETCNYNIVGTEEGTVFVYEIKQQKACYAKKTHVDSINGIVFTQKNNLITIGGDKFCIHDYGKNRIIFNSIMQYPLTCIDITADGKYFAIGTNKGTIFIFKTENYINPAITLTAHNSSISCIKYSNMPQFINKDSDSLLVPNLEYTPQNNESNIEILGSKYENVVKQDGILNLLKSEFISNINEYVEEMEEQVNVTVQNLQEYIAREFQKINVQFEDKCDLLDFFTENYIVDHVESEHVYQEHLMPD